MRRLMVVFVVLFAMSALTVGIHPVSAQETATETPVPTATEANESANETDELGTQLTAFLQSSSAAANDSVDNGMWKANFERASAAQRGEVVAKRTGTLERRLDRLQAQNESLQERYENGSISEQAYVAQQSRLAARIDGLKTAVADTDTAAKRAGVDDDRLDRLRQSAGELKGPEIAEIASGLAGGPPADVPGRADDRPGGPPEAGVTGENETDNETRGNSENPGNAPENRGKSGESTSTDDEMQSMSRTLDALVPF